jgi:sulfate transporter 4
MSFAKLAGLPVQFGLYSSFVPIYAYSVFGTSHQLAIGTSAVSSLIFSSVMNELNPKMTADEYQSTAVKLALLTGIMYTCMGLLRLGFITTFLSRAVIGGFTSGSALIIGFSQLKYMLGYNVPGTDKLPQLLKSLIMDISKFNYKTFLLGCLCIMCILGIKHVGMTYTRYNWMKALGPITVCVITILVSWLADLSALGIPTITSIPPGLPHITINEWGLGANLLKPAISLVIVGFMESISVAKKMATQHKYEIDSSLELVGLGMANFIGSMFSIYPVVGSISRTAVNNDAGALSAISGIVTATIVMLVLLFFTFVFEYLVSLSILQAICAFD